MKLLSGKTALITGSSRGIGAATAQMLADHGAAVVVNYMNSKQAADQIVKDIEVKGGKAYAIQADVSDPIQIKELIAKSNEKLGQIDILVLNASFNFPIVPFLQYKWEDFETKLTNEMKSAFHCCKEVVPDMIARKSGHIIAVSSGLSRQPGFGFCAHSSAKSALDAFAKSLALELGPESIRVNVIAPGLTDTDATSNLPEDIKQMIASQTPLKRYAVPEDIAGAILMLAADQSKFITGAYIPVSGGIQII